MSAVWVSSTAKAIPTVADAAAMTRANVGNMYLLAGI
jgi:hypothetical protein